MKRIQLIFCVETNKQSDTDFLYIKSTIDRFYEYKNGHIQIKPVYCYKLMNEVFCCHNASNISACIRRHPPLSTDRKTVFVGLRSSLTRNEGF